MKHKTWKQTPEAALKGSMRDFRVPQGSDLLERIGSFYEWQDGRRRSGLWPFSRATETGVGAECAARDDAGNGFVGVNFASQDYLSLSSHSAIKDVARETLARYGVHSAGSAALVGNTGHSVKLEALIAEFMEMPEAILYPTGWAAGYGIIRGLVRSADHIVMDQLSHTCLQEGANASTRNIYQFRHNSLEHCEHWLKKIRSQDAVNGIMVITESLFSMDSDTPDLRKMQELCHAYGATLMVDAAHDLGALGPGGRGHIGAQGMLGKIDIVMGSFSKTFASNGGFVACRNRALKEYLRFFSPSCTFSNALSPVQAAVIAKAFEIVGSAEGDELRAKLMGNVIDLRGKLEASGLEVYGDPSAIVAVKMGSEALARLVSRRLPELGLIANLVEYPAVPKAQARFRMQVMAGHTESNVEAAVRRLCAAREFALGEIEDMAGPAEMVAAA
jgi:glycine C-acetyltransferase